MNWMNIPIKSERGSSPLLVAGRVTKVLLDLNDPEYKNCFSKYFQGNLAIGAIEIQPLVDVDNLSKGYARPLFSNSKYYPIVGEIVTLIAGPSPRTTQTSDLRLLYYLPPFNVYNNTHYNVLPFNEDSEVEFGNTFEESEEVQSLLPFEGDHIIEGRWGNSMRMGSTVTDSFTNNEWSQDGENGDPIIIIRNGQKLSEQEVKGFILEDINKDDSSLYICSNQSLPIDVASKNLQSFGLKLEEPESPNIVINNELPVNPYTITRFEGEFVIVQDEQGNELKIKKSDLVPV